MKKIALIILICLSFSIEYSNASSVNKILLTTQNWSPYQTYENNVMGGFAVQVVRCVLEKMGQPNEIEEFPWKRAQNMVKKGEAHGFFSASRNEIRDQYATLSKPIAPQKWNWYLLKENPLNPVSDSFKKEARVGATFGSNMNMWLNKNGYQTVGNVKNTELLIKLLIDKRVDAILANELVLNAILEKTKTAPEKFHIYLNRNKPLGVYWSNEFLSKHPHFLERFNSLIEGCRGEKQ